MSKNLIIFFVAAAFLVSCHKTQQKTPCGTQVCTGLFAVIGVHYFDKNNNPVIVSDFKVFDLTANKNIVRMMPPNYHPTNYMEVVDDNDLKDLSTGGDNISVSATNPATGQVKTIDMKISGGCNCHVAKLSGPDTVKFD